MSLKADNPKDSELEQADSDAVEKVTSAIDRSQVTINFGQEEPANKMTEKEFREMAEAEMRNRAEEGKRLRDELEAQKKRQQEQKTLEEAQEKVHNELRRQKDVNALEIRNNEEARVIQKAEQESNQKGGVEAKHLVIEEEKNRLAEAEAAIMLVEEERIRKEAEDKRLAQEDTRLMKKEYARKLRDAEWEKFKEEADLKRNLKTEEPIAYADKPQEIFDESAHTKKTSSKRRVIFLVWIAALLLAGFWIFSELNPDVDEAEPFFPNNSPSGVEVSDVSSEQDATQSQISAKNTDDANKTKNQAGDASVSIPPKSQVGSSVSASSNFKVGSIFDEGVLFKIDASGEIGTLAYNKDIEPLTWENAMKIEEQLGKGWRLPTMEELSEMYKTIGPGATNSGKFTDELYWSSQAFDKDQARLVRFSDGNTSFHYNKKAPYRTFKIRAVKDFNR